MTKTTFSDKTALVFASSRGIGRATALKLGLLGVNVVVTYAGNEEEALKVVKSIRSSGSLAVAAKTDVSDFDSVVSAFDTAKSAFGGVDIVVNAAGASAFGLIQNMPTAELERLVSVNVKGAFHVLSESARTIRDGGSIVHFSTGGTKMAVSGGGVYAGTKAAGELMAIGLAKELGERRVNVNVISPGVTNTDGLIMPDEQIQMLIKQTPLGRLGEPEDVADAVVFLVSEQGRWVNGQNLQANGGIL